MPKKRKPSTRVNQTGAGVHKDKRTKRNRSRTDNKRNAIAESREQRDVNTRAARPTSAEPFEGRKTNAMQWNRWTP